MQVARILAPAFAALAMLAASFVPPVQSADTVNDAPDVKVPEGWLLIQEDVWYALADEPDRHFQEARMHFLRGNHPAAAADIRKGAAMLKLAAAASPGAEKKPLQASILELETLAAREDAGKVHSARTLDRIFARAYLALAGYNEGAARRHLRVEEPDKAAVHLRSAALDLQHSVLWDGQTINDELMHVLVDAEAAALKLLQRTDKAFTNAVKTLDALHAEFKQMQELMKAAE
jgi:hypothetical protein